MHEDLKTLPPALRTLGEDLDRAMRTSKHNRTPPLARRGRGLVLTAALVTAIATVLAIALAGQNGPLGSQVPVADALERAARAALTAPSLMPRDDEYYYVHS